MADDRPDDPALDPDHERLLAAFMILSKTRQAAPEGGVGSLSVSGMTSLYEAERWHEGDLDLFDFMETMLELDAAFVKFVTDRAPRQREDVIDRKP